MTDTLSGRISSILSKKRFNHVLGVVDMAVYLGNKCLPSKLSELKHAAFLHDITKELTYDENVKLLGDEWDGLSDDEKNSRQILHSYSAPYYVREHFCEYATDDVLSAIRNHTVGSPEMSIFDEIIFLADYIEDGREYKTCTLVREFVKSSMSDDVNQNIITLHRACVMAIDYTIQYLLAHNLPIIFYTALARDSLLRKIQQN